jgi:hypothetical protein
VIGLPAGSSVDYSTPGQIKLNVATMPGVSPKLTSIAKVGSTIHIFLEGEPNKGYQLQSTGDLKSSFADFGAPQSTNASGQAEFIDAGPLPVQRFYRASQAP